MKQFFYHVLASLLLVLSNSISGYSADLLKPKHEMRSVWLATVLGIDWPTVRNQETDAIVSYNLITSTGNAAEIEKQKQLMTTMLDSLAKNNINCVNFQVRSRCDAMYKSAYEPWSADLVAVRGMDPGYDPLKFVVEECHKRGMECHAWVNPYRYELNRGEWGVSDYRVEHPDWIMDFKTKSILNPGLPEVVQRIVDVCKDIITNYDVDGILYDDYFYINDYVDASGNKESYALDKDLYDKYVAEGGVLSQGDWRRENINVMLKAVYDMIQEVKPWVRFGVSPAGTAASARYVADKYGVTPCPGGDWQYEDIHSDPLAWLSRRTLDFISPQVYWPIGYEGLDYSLITPWWSETAAKFGRHLYVSHSISSLRLSSKEELSYGAGADGFSNAERTIMAQAKAAGSEKTFKEYADQVKINRESSRDDAPGSIFFSAKHVHWMAPLFGHYLKNTVFSKPAILPALTYKPGYNPGNVKNPVLSGNKLSWEGYDNVRYTVYAVPVSVAQKDFNCEVDYLLGTSYSTEYEIPEGYGSGYQFAVCVLDRVGNEYSPVFAGAEVKTLAAPKLTAPADGSTKSGVFDFEWSAVDGVGNYILEIAYDAAFRDMFRTCRVAGTKLPSADIEGIKPNVKLYWRVRSTGVNCDDGVSAAFTVTPKVLTISSPVHNSVVGVTPVIEWNYEEGNTYTVEIATDAGFKSVVASSEATGSYAVPEYTLKSFSHYFTRVRATNNSGESLESNVIEFNTGFVDARIPVVVFPKEGDKLYSEDKITLERQPGVHSFNIEVAASDVFPRNKFSETLKDFNYQSKKGDEIKLSGKGMVAGETYYLRADALYVNEYGVKMNTKKCDVISFVYGGSGSVDSNLSETEVKISGTADPILMITLSGWATVEAKAFSSLGIQEEVLYKGEADGSLEIPLTQLTRGMHLISVNINGSVRVLKVIK